MRLPITRERIRTQFPYGWWQYALLIGRAIFGWNLLYTTTRYRSPEALKVEWYCQGAVSMEAQAGAKAGRSNRLIQIPSPLGEDQLLPLRPLPAV